MTDLSTALAERLADRYRIEGEIGRGGMGVVFLAQDLQHGRPVALKVLLPELGTAIGAARFLREIQIAARLTHPHIVSVHDSGAVDDALYYVMPYIAGGSLRARLTREQQLSIEETVRIASQVADALHYAHERGIIHRDIKPENILFAGSHAMVTDFGVARAIADATLETLTATGRVVGTVTYASPEQVSAVRELDGRADLYSLGCVVYEMLTGEPPFTGPNSQAVMARHLTSPPPSVRVVRPAVPEAVSASVTRALAKVPADRFETVSEFARVLAAALDPDATATAAPRRSIAVLPFVNLSPDPESEYFSDGITEEIMTSLSRIPDLRVTARTSSFAFKGKTQDVRSIGEHLGVGTVLEGSVRRAGGRLRVTAQLIETGQGYQLWTERFDRQLEDVFAIQDEIAARIAKALKVVLGESAAPSAGRTTPANLQAYDSYLRGRQLFHQFRRRGFEQARDLFRQAVVLDPSYTRAWAGIAEASSYLYTIFDATEANAREAESASRRAVQLDPDLPEARTALACALSSVKRFEEAWTHFEAAIRLNPNLFETWNLYARAGWLAGDLAKAVKCFDRASEIRPEDFQSLALGATAWEGLGETAEARRRHQAALDRAHRHLELFPNDGRALSLGACAAIRLGNRGLGEEWIERALRLDPDDPPTVYKCAGAYAVMGKTEEALDCLERCHAMGLSHRDWIAHDADLVSLHGHPRFEALLSQATPAAKI